MSIKIQSVSTDQYVTTGKKRRIQHLLNNNNKQAKVSKHPNMDYNIPLSNRFDTLSDFTEDEDEDAETQNKPSSLDIKKQKIPPIVVYCLFHDHAKSIQSLKDKLNEDIDIKFKVNRIIIFSKCQKDHEIICRTLKTNKIEFHTYTLPSQKLLKMVLKDVAPNLTCDEILESLTDQNLNVESVRQMSKKEGDKKIPFPIYVVTFKAGTVLQEVLGTRKVCEYLAKWEKYKNSEGVTQCYKCQSFGHTAPNCNKLPKCVRCTEQHNVKECPLSKEQEELHRCANCNGNHRASNRQCPIYVRQAQNKQVLNSAPSKPAYAYSRANFPPINPRQEQSNESPNLQYNPVNNVSQNNETNHNLFSELISEFKNIFNFINIPKAILHLKTLPQKLRSLPDTFSKIMLIVEVVGEVFNNSDGK